MPAALSHTSLTLHAYAGSLARTLGLKFHPSLTQLSSPTQVLYPATRMFSPFQGSKPCLIHKLPRRGREAPSSLEPAASFRGLPFYPQSSLVYCLELEAQSSESSFWFRSLSTAPESRSNGAVATAATPSKANKFCFAQSARPACRSLPRQPISDTKNQ